MEVTRSLDDSIFGTILRGSSVYFEPAMQLPISSRCRYCRGFASVSIEAQQLLCSIGLHLQHHPLTTPPEVSRAGSWTVPPSWTPVAMVYRAVYLAYPDGHFYDQGVQQPLKADTAHSQMDPLMPRMTTRPCDAHSRQIQPTHRWIHSCQE